MRAQDTMSRDIIAVPPELDLAAAWRLMQRESIRHLPVLKNARLVGIVSDRDLLARAATRHGKLAFDTALVVQEAMSAAPFTCLPDTRIDVVARAMIEQKIDAVPIVDKHDTLVGLVTSTDLLSLLLDRTDETLPFQFNVVTAEGEPVTAES
jgi:CBS domain-containing protein